MEESGQKKKKRERQEEEENVPLCAFSKLGKCQNPAAKSRHATESWLQTDQVSDEEKEVLKDQALCMHHYNLSFRPVKKPPPKEPKKQGCIGINNKFHFSLDSAKFKLKLMSIIKTENLMTSLSGSMEGRSVMTKEFLWVAS